MHNTVIFIRATFLIPVAQLFLRFNFALQRLFLTLSG